MADHVQPSVVETTETFYHVRFRDPEEFDEIRTPEWASSPAASVVEGSEVRTGHQRAGDDWRVQSVLIPTDTIDSEQEATDRAVEIVEKIEE